MLDKNTKIIYKFLKNNYGNAISIDEFNLYCEKHNISQKETIDFFIKLLNEKSISNRNDGTFIPLLNSKLQYNDFKKSIHDKWLSYLITFILGIVSTLLTTLLLSLI